MKKVMKRMFFLLTSMMFVLMLYSGTAQAAVKLNKTKSALKEGTSTTLKVTGTKKKVTWKSSNKKVATVSDEGRVTARKAGKAVIKAKIGKKTLKCVVTVKAVPVLSVNKKKVKLEVGESATVQVTFSKDTPYGVGASNSDSTVSHVAFGSWKGNVIPLKITAKEEGTCRITVTNTYNDEKIPIKVIVTEAETEEETEEEEE